MGISRILGLVVATAFVVAAMAIEGSAAGAEICFVLLLPVAMIMFPEELTTMTGHYLWSNFDRESSPLAVSMTRYGVVWTK